MLTSFRFPVQGKIAALRGSRSIDRTTGWPKKETRFIRIFFKHKMLPIHEKAIRLREWVNVHLKTRGKTLDISLFKIDKPGLPATGTAALTLEGRHEKRDSPFGIRLGFSLFTSP
jgi:hypothetical protein